MLSELDYNSRTRRSLVLIHCVLWNAFGDILEGNMREIVGS